MTKAFTVTNPDGSVLWRTTHRRWLQFLGACYFLAICIVGVLITALHGWGGIQAFQLGLRAGLVPAVTVIAADLVALVVLACVVANVMLAAVGSIARRNAWPGLTRWIDAETQRHATSRQSAFHVVNRTT